MKVYHVQGIRLNAIIFDETAEEAIVQAAEQGLVGDWESPITAAVILNAGEPECAPV